MNQLLLPVVQQLLNADDVRYTFLTNNKTKGTIIVEDAEKNWCEFYGFPATIDRSQENLKATIIERITKNSTTTVRLKLRPTRIFYDVTSALLLTKYCALVLEHPVPRLMHTNKNSDGVMMASYNDLSITAEVASKLIKIQEIFTDMTDIKQWILEHSI